MNLDDALRLVEQCSEIANPWPKNDTRHMLYNLGYTRALLASIIKEDAMLRYKITEHSKQQQLNKKPKRQ